MGSGEGHTIPRPGSGVKLQIVHPEIGSDFKGLAPIWSAAEPIRPRTVYPASSLVNQLDFLLRLDYIKYSC